jgi:hypothetical protein
MTDATTSDHAEGASMALPLSGTAGLSAPPLGPSPLVPPPLVPPIARPSAFRPSLFLAETSTTTLVASALLPLLAAAWLLLSPGRIFSREMTWDLLFNLAGAWQLHSGQVAHVDFHDPLGALSFILTDIGFHVVGFTAFAFVIGLSIACAAIFAAAIAVVRKRLPLVPALVFVLYVVLLVLMPTNVGDPPTAYSFAMSYNRVGWSALSILFLIFFMPPRFAEQREDEKAGLADPGIALLLLVALYYLKITYFLAGIGGLTVALVISDHIRADRRSWLTVWCIVAVNAIAPYNFDYLRDIAEAIIAGDARTDLRNCLVHFLENGAENALVLVQLLIVVWLWACRQAMTQLLLGCIFIVVTGLFVLSQNAQGAQIPLYIVISCLLYDALRRELVGAPAGGGQVGNGWQVAPLLAAPLVFPALLIGGTFVSLIGYQEKASGDADALIVDRTNLHGLSVPAQPAGLLHALARGEISFDAFNRARNVKPRYELSQFEYVETLLEAAALFGDDPDPHTRIVLLDQVNPMPFMLGLAPPKGGNLWYGPGLKWRSPAEIFTDADIVLVPKFPTFGSSTAEAVRRYGAALARDFPVVSHELPSWTVMRRAAPPGSVAGVTTAPDGHGE